MKDAQDTKAARRKDYIEPETAGEILNGLSSGILVIDSSGKILSVNPAFEDIAGYSAGEIAGGNLHEVLPRLTTRTEAHLLDEAFAQCIKGHAPQLSTVVITTRNGDKVAVRPEIHLLPDKDSRPARTVLCFQPEAKHAMTQPEEDLAHHRELMQRIFDNIPVLLVLWDARLQKFTLNRHAEEVLGWSTEDANQGDFLSKVYPDEEYRKRVANYMQSLSPGWHEWLTTAKDGTAIPCDWANIRLTDNTMIGIGVDLRERKKAEQTLRESEETLRKAMMAGQVFTFEWTPATDEVSRSANCGSILGIAGEGCTSTSGQEHLSRIPGKDRERLEETIEALSPDKPEYETEYRYKRPDGKTIWIEESGSGEFDENGNLLRVYGIVADVTNRVQAEDRERTVAAAESAIDTVNAMGEGVVLAGLDGTVTAMNPAAEELSGLSEEDVIGHNLRCIIPSIVRKEYLEDTLKALDQIGNGQRPEFRHIVLHSPGAGPVTVSPSVRFIESPEGKPMAAVLTLKDVTRLHEANELLRQVFDNTHMHIAYLDGDFNFVRVNRAYAEAKGRKPEFFIGKNHFALFPGEENEMIFSQVRDSGQPYVAYERPFEHPDQPGRTTYWDWTLHAVKGDEDETEGLLLCLVDATERVRMREQLIESEQKYRDLVESANSIIMRITPDHRITFFNEYAQSFFAYTPQEVLGRSVIGTITPEIESTGRNMKKLIRDITAHPELYGSNENEGMKKDGTRVWVHWSNRAIRDNRGNVVEILCVGTDITRRKELERKTLNYQKRLRGLTTRLIKTEEEERRRVATHIHDTIIQTLSLSNVRLGGVKASLKSAEMDDQLKRVEGIRSLLDEGIKECRNLMGQLVPSLLYELGLIPALRDFAEKQHELDGTPIEVVAGEDLEPLDDAKRGLLFQCARELTMNALKYAGQCNIRIALGRNNGNIRLEVSDTGCGFDPASATGNHAHEEEGGFGLFSIRERLEGLGGQLVIDSEPGQGTNARIELPL
jgi:PAS domain S-box-containing protein